MGFARKRLLKPWNNSGGHYFGKRNEYNAQSIENTSCIAFIEESGLATIIERTVEPEDSSDDEYPYKTGGPDK